jgi:hypothetical protein
MLRLVALAGRACLHEVLDDCPLVRRVETATKPMEGALNALVAVFMDCGHQLVQQW